MSPSTVQRHRRYTAVVLILIVALCIAPAWGIQTKHVNARRRRRSFGMNRDLLLTGGIPCTSSADCSASKPLCYKSAFSAQGICVECYQDSDCQQGHSCLIPQYTCSSAYETVFSVQFVGVQRDNIGMADTALLCKNMMSILFAPGNCTVTSVIADGSAVATGVVRTTSLSHAGSLAAELVQPSAEVRISSGFNTTLRVLYASPQSIPPPLPTYPPQHVNASASCLQQHQGPSIHLQWSPPANSSGAKDLWYSVSCVSYGDTVEGLFKPTITQAILHPVAQNMPYSCGVTTVSSQGSSTTVADPVVTLNATICLPA